MVIELFLTVSWLVQLWNVLWATFKHISPLCIIYNWMTPSTKKCWRYLIILNFNNPLELIMYHYQGCESICEKKSEIIYGETTNYFYYL